MGDRGFSAVVGWLGLVRETMGDKQLAVLSLRNSSCRWGSGCRERALTQL